jgi:TolB-like protein/predicted Zn-dependent protease
MLDAARSDARFDALIESYGDKSIAVLPFVNMSPDPDQQYFSDGISEELLNLLAQTPELRVISRTTAFALRDQDLSIPTIGKRLNVAHVLEGSVRKSGNRVRITAQLIETVTDTHLWSETYDRELDDIFAIQDEIAAKVVDDLRLRLLGTTPRSEQVDSAAYELYPKARHILHSGEPFRDTEAAQFLEHALVLEPNWMRAMAELGRVYARLHSANADLRDAYEDKLWDLLDRMRAVEPGATPVLTLEAWLQWTLRDDVQAAAHLERASQADPNDVDLLRALAIFMTFLNRIDEAAAIGEYLVANDPGCAVCIHALARTLRLAGRHREAAQKLESLRQWHTLGPAVYWPLGVCWLVAGEPEKALAAFDRIQGEGQRALGRLLALHDMGRLDQFQGELEVFQETAHPEPLARIYA